jgi:hypothetical protein
MGNDVWVGFLSAILTVAGLLLIFCGFLFQKAEGYDTTRGDKYKLWAKLGVIPLIASFASAWVCTLAIGGNGWAIAHGFLIFNIALALSAVYSIISLLGL